MSSLPLKNNNSSNNQQYTNTDAILQKNIVKQQLLVSPDKRMLIKSNIQPANSSASDSTMNNTPFDMKTRNSISHTGGQIKDNTNQQQTLNNDIEQDDVDSQYELPAFSKRQQSYHQKMLESQQALMLQQQQQMHTPRTKQSPLKKKQLPNVAISGQNQESDGEVRNEKIRVAVRVRPQLKAEIGKECVCHVGKNGKQIRVQDMTHIVEGAYDLVLGRNARQPDVFQFVSDCVPSLLQGFNCTIFAYGQTGSGKTFTMFGQGIEQLLRQMAAENNGDGVTPQGSIMSMMKPVGAQSITNGSTTDNSQVSGATQQLTPHANQGIIPRCIGELYQAIRTQGLKVTTYCSFLQIYNEKLYDLLQDTYTKHPLQIREDKVQGIYVEGLSEYIVQSEADCLVLLARGERNRIKRATKMNIKSSRSHSLFQLLIETDQVDAKGMLKRSKLNLGDLAGSEKINKDEEMQAKHMLELRNINLSLTTLGKVIAQLSTNSTTQQAAPQHIPFRESKLTRLLQDSVGGNTSTYLIATVAPTIDNIEETISTLKFADRAKCVMQRVRKNEINAKDDALVQKLQREVQYLKELLMQRRKGAGGDITHQLYILKDENERLRAMAMDYEEVERMKQENKNMRLELQKLKNMALSEFNGSVYPQAESSAQDGDQSPSPKSMYEQQQDRSPMPSKIISKTSIKKPASHSLSEQKSHHPNNEQVAPDSTPLSDSEDIQMQFQKYQSQTDDLATADGGTSKSVKHHKQKQLDTPQSEVVVPLTDRVKKGQGVGKGYSMVQIQNSTTEDVDREVEIHNLKQSRIQLQNMIEQEHHNMKIQGSNNNPQPPVIKRKFRNESTDLTNSGNKQLQLPLIGSGQPNHTPLSMVRVNSNVDVRSGNIIVKPAQQKYPINSNGPSSANVTNPYLIASGGNQQSMSHQESFNSRQPYDLRTIEKYPNQNANHLQMLPPGNVTSMRMSMNSVIMNGGGGFSGFKGNGPIRAGKVSQSSVYSGGMLMNMPSSDDAASNYIMAQGSPRLPPQTVVRIRGKNNQTIETKGSLVMSLEEEKRQAERRRQIRRSNERLRMLENMERDRHEKMEMEIARINQHERLRQEAEQAIGRGNSDRSRKHVVGAKSTNNRYGGGGVSLY